MLTAASFGAAPFLIALAVQHFPPLTLGALRAAFGLPLLLIVAGLIGKPGWNGGEAVVTALVGGILVIATPFVTLAVGLQYIPSGMGRAALRDHAHFHVGAGRRSFCATSR